MYSLSLREVKEKLVSGPLADQNGALSAARARSQAMVDEASQRRHRSLTKPSPEHRDRVLLSVYGQNRDGMAQMSQSRRGDWMSRAVSHPEMSSILQPPADPTGLVFHHTFRDRKVEKELGRSTAACRPRATCRASTTEAAGTSTVQRRRRSGTRSHEDGASERRHARAREATASLVDQGKTRCRLKQPPYSNPGYFLRVREQSKEVGPPMRYAAKNEMERVHDSLSNLTVNDSGEWDEGELFPVWRHVAPSKWKGGRKRLHTAPATGLSHSVTGEPHFAPIHSSEPHVIHRQSSHAVRGEG